MVVKNSKREFVVVLLLLLLISLYETLSVTAIGKSFNNACRGNPSSPASQWSAYTGKGEEFMVSLPERPAVHIKQRPKLISGRPPSSSADYEIGRIYGAYADGVVYVIMSFDLKGTKGRLEDFVKEYRKYHRPESEMTFIRDVVEDDIYGKQYHIKMRDIDGILHFYGTATHIYVLQAVGDKENNPSVRYFLGSFTIQGKPVAKDMLKSPAGAQVSQTNSTVSAPSIQAQDTDSVFTSKEVTRRALVVARPEPTYTEHARMGNVSGKIVIRAVLTSLGTVDRINVIAHIPGLTKQAVEAIRNIKFIPAVKDGKLVSQYATFEYHFGFY